MTRPKKRGTEYPFEMGLVPTEWQQPFINDPRYKHLNIGDECEQFRDRAIAGKDGKVVVYICWHAAFRTWMRNALKWNPAPVVGLERSTSKGGWQEYAKLNGINSKPGESWPMYQARVEHAMKNETPKLSLIGGTGK